MLKYVPLFVVFFCILAIPATAQTAVVEIPPDYQSDGCTAFPDGNYRDCCVAHDRDYYVGGTCKQRRAADGRLYRCVKSKKGWKNKFIAPIMWLGVRVMGAPFIPTSARWGFGRKKAKAKGKRKKEKIPVNSEK